MNTGCDHCDDVLDGELIAVIDDVRFCRRCWKKAGRPWPRSVATVLERHRAEVVTRERMQKRGGADRHLVRKGLT